MRTIAPPIIALTLALAFPAPASAFNSDMKASLLRLDPVTRLEQRCDVAVMERIRQDHGAYNPDRVVAYTFAEPKIDGDEIKTRGAAFRSKGDWYHLTFRCKTTPDHIGVLALRYKVGERIPPEDWKRYNLWR
ncbi:DUF930 domain-containing protein [Nitratireductor soli]|uniref:DUF930 domain-containing protein n=1 Tax=Nitratireductor soli TaxID=1670619 RepID=UPI00065DEDE0|nr:DUF930 domain-containing protein [Nitratireductor soli]